MRAARFCRISVRRDCALWRPLVGPVPSLPGPFLRSIRGPFRLAFLWLVKFFANFFAHNHSCFSGVVFVAVFWSLLSGQRLGLSGSFFGSSLLWTSSKDFVRCEFVPNFDPILFHKICARIPIPLFRIGISVFGHKKNSAFDRVLFRLDPLRTTASRSRWPFRSFRFSPLPWLFSLAHVLAFRSRKQAVPTSFDLL